MHDNASIHDNVGQFLTRRAFRDPHMEAMIEPASGRRFTYKELNERANRIAGVLSGLDAGHGDRVGILLMNGVEFLETFFGAGKIGAVCVPLNWRLVADELEFILRDSGATHLVYGAEFAQLAEELHRRDNDEGHNPSGPRLRHWIQVGGERLAFAVDYDDALAAANPAEPQATAGGDDLLFIMYTSGTTGLPKGVMHSHDTMMWSILTVNATADMRYQDRYILALPFFHVGALNPALSIVLRGCTGIIMRAFDPKLVWEIVETEKVTTMLAVPAMLNFMLQVGTGDRNISTLRWIMSGAAPVPVTLIKAYEGLGIEIHQVYGLTESGGPACLISSDDALTRAGSTGKAFFHTEVKVVREDGTECAPNEPGEVIVAGPHIMVGYWNRPDATAASIRDGWLYTGDVAAMDEEGFVTIMDRIKDMLISGGENVYPAEIENVILANPKVGDVAVIGIPSAKWGESPLAVVVSKDESLTADEVISACHGHLASFKIPRAVEFVTEIPRNPSGKILKRELRERFTYSAAE